MKKELILGPRTEEVKNKIRQKAKKIRFILRSPDGAIYEGENLLQFVQENAGLFDPGDTVRKRAKNSTFRFRESHAAHGLACLNPDRKNPFPRWKGWTWVLNEEQQKRRVELDQIKAEKSKERQEAAMLLRSEGIKKSWTPERKDKLRQEMHVLRAAYKSEGKRVFQKTLDRVDTIMDEASMMITKASRVDLEV